jgi:pimeloyl-ACP methyl ester carboxylesterase
MLAQTTLADGPTKGMNASLNLAEVKGAVPILLLPGTLCDARIFEPLAKTFVGHATRDIAISGAASTMAIARRILADAPPAFALVGFSLGGIIALEIAAIAPDRISGLALIATTARADLAGNAALRREAVADARKRGLAAHFADHVWPNSTAPANREDAILQAKGIAMAEMVGVEAFAEQAEIAIARADGRPRLPALKMPVLVLCGDADSICPPDRHSEIADAIPGADLVVIPDAGHFVLLESPAAVAPHLARWLKILSINNDTLTNRTARQTKDFQ